MNFLRKGRAPADAATQTRHPRTRRILLFGAPALLLLGWALIPAARGVSLLANRDGRHAPDIRQAAGLPVREVHFMASDGVALAGWLALADGNLYLAAQLPGSIGDAHGHLINPEAVYALDGATGSLRWIYRTASVNRGKLAAGEGAVYLRADDGLHAIRASDGTRLWPQADFETEGYGWGGGGEGPAGPQWDAPLDAIGPVVFDGRFDALPASADHPSGCYAPCRVREDLYALSASTGVAFWSVPIGPTQDVVVHSG